MDQDHSFKFDDSHGPKRRNFENAEEFSGVYSNAATVPMSEVDASKFYSNHNRNQSLPNTSLNRENAYTTVVTGRPTRAATYSRGAAAPGVYTGNQNRYIGAPAGLTGPVPPGSGSTAAVQGFVPEGVIEIPTQQPSPLKLQIPYRNDSHIHHNGGTSSNSVNQGLSNGGSPEQIVAGGTTFEILSPISPGTAAAQNMLLRGPGGVIGNGHNNSSSASPQTHSPSPIVGLGVGGIEAHLTNTSHQYSGSIAIPSLQSIQTRIQESNNPTLGQRSVSGPATVSPPNQSSKAKSSEPKTPSEYALHILFTQVRRLLAKHSERSEEQRVRAEPGRRRQKTRD